MRGSLLALTVVMGFLYVLQMNITATKGYDIRELEQQIATLEKDARDLNLQALELQSMDRMIAQLPEFGLEQARPDAFLSTSTTVVAAR
jgi:cell division protein FtsL